MTDAQGSATARIGEVINGRYRVERRLSDSHGVETYEAGDLQLGHHVAIEFLQESRADDKELITSLRREAGLQSENILHVIDYGVGGDGVLYFCGG